MTNSDAIRDLTKTVATLEERLDNARKEIERVDTKGKKIYANLIEVDKRLALIEERSAEIRKTSDENDRRRWTVSLALIGSLLTLAANIGLLFPKK